MSRAEQLLLQKMNDVRSAHGLPALRYDEHLQRAARAHSREMLADGVFEHGAFGLRMIEFNVRGQITGENIAWGSGLFGTPGSIFDAWLGSPEHRANILRPSFNRVGLSDLIGAFLGHDDAHVVTADFAG
jgi:uncharacterized protein YkwD